MLVHVSLIRIVDCPPSFPSPAKETTDDPQATPPPGLTPAGEARSSEPVENVNSDLSRPDGSPRVESGSAAAEVDARSEAVCGEDDCTGSGSEDGNDDDDEDDEDEDDDEDMRRILAFANRSRASGSGLPPALATLNRVVETAESSDQETAELFMSGVAGVLRDQRTIQESVALVLEQGLTVAESTSAADGVGPQVPPTEEELAFSACLSRLAAFKKIGATRLDPTITQGVTPEFLETQPKKPALSLRRKLMVYQCELDVYAACTERGILYTEPEALFLHPDVVVLGLARVVERGTIGPGNPRTN